MFSFWSFWFCYFFLKNSLFQVDYLVLIRTLLQNLIFLVRTNYGSITQVPLKGCCIQGSEGFHGDLVDHALKSNNLLMLNFNAAEDTTTDFLFLYQLFFLSDCSIPYIDLNFFSILLLYLFPTLPTYILQYW